MLNSKDRKGRIIGNAKYGVYAFYDYDGEPIYVGQTWEKLRGRIGRHLNNQRTDAVAMNVLDPFEVAEIELWPFFDLSKKNSGKVLNRAEFAVYRLLLRRRPSRIPLQSSRRGRIVGDSGRARPFP